MENWTFPANYDESYRPEPTSPYWFPERETMDPDERDKRIAERIRDVMEHAYATSNFYRTKWDAAGIKPQDVRSLADFEDVPVVTKQEMRASQAAHPPFGDYLCVPESEIFHIHGTSGTTGQPTAFAVGRDDWRAIANNHARIMWGMGLRPGDTVFIAAIFSLYLGSWGALAGAERLGCAAFPFGAGASGMTARAVQWLKATKPAGFYATPSYALRLAEVAREADVDPKEFGLKAMFFSGEPGASIPGVRERIRSEFGAQVYDCGTMAEMTPFMSAAATEGTPEGMLLWQDIVYHEVCDPTTFRRVPYGGEGTPVYTHLERTSQPMIRLASGDITRWVMEQNPCGRTYPRLPDGVYGRVDDMFQVRGENVYPSEIEKVLHTVPDYGGEHRILISRQGSMDELLLQVEHASRTLGPASARFADAVSAQMQALLGLRVRVEAVTAGTFERFDHKARRVIDDRNLLQQVRARLAAER